MRTPKILSALIALAAMVIATGCHKKCCYEKSPSFAPPPCCPAPAGQPPLPPVGF